MDTTVLQCQNPSDTARRLFLQPAPLDSAVISCVAPAPPPPPAGPFAVPARSRGAVAVLCGRDLGGPAYPRSAVDVGYGGDSAEFLIWLLCVLPMHHRQFPRSGVGAHDFLLTEGPRGPA